MTRPEITAKLSAMVEKKINPHSEIEKTEDNSVCREFIIHPDGTISGSWNKNMKVIKK